MATSLISSGVRFSDNSIQSTIAFTGFRNKIINGDMRISQRGSSFASANVYTLDRYLYATNTTSSITITQNTDVPANGEFSNSLHAVVTTADTSISVSDYSLIVQNIEGYNVVDLVGVPFTLSFWVKSSKTGVHCVTLRNAGYNRAYVVEYIINFNNAWEKKSITFPNGLNTSSGTWNFTNGIGVQVGWCMAVGNTYQSLANTWIDANVFSTANQVNCLDTVGNIFAITGVQLEKGSVATDFEYRPYQVELSLCHRYYQRLTTFIEASPASGGINSHAIWIFKVPMRTSPIMTNTGLGANGTIYNINYDLAGIYKTTGIACWGATSTASAEL